MAAFFSVSCKARARLRPRWHRFRLDMTPLVDLALLLLTFFLLHTTYAKAHVMQLSMPVKTAAMSSPETSGMSMD